MRSGANAPPLRVLALVTDAFGAPGGIAQYNRDLLEAMSHSPRVHEIVLLARSGTANSANTTSSADSALSAALPAKLRQLEPRAGKWAWTWSALRAVWRDGPFDLVFAGHLYSAPVAALVARLAQAPLWLQLHGIEAWRRPSRWQHRAAESASLVTAVSRYTRRRFLAWAPCEPHTVKVLPNTVDDRFEPGPPSTELQRRHRLQSRKVLLTVSRLASAERYKGHDQVLRALAHMASTQPELVYVIAGDGDDRPRLEALARELGVHERTRFVGHVPDEELPDLYRTANVFVMPSTGEGFGIVFLQALACGIPVIACDQDGSVDPLRDGINGHLVAGDDTARLVTAIEDALAQAHAPACACEPFERGRFNREVARLLTFAPQRAGTR